MTSPAHDTVKTRPILFSGAMVRAILAGKKTQTRRVVTPAPPDWISEFGFNALTPTGSISGIGCYEDLGPAQKFYPMKYGVPGDRLWVKETWGARSDRYLYRADYGDDAYPDFRWRPSIHMSRAASRTTLELEAVRIERLQAISEEDARAEGVVSDMDALGDMQFMRPMGAMTARQKFAVLWESINAKREGCSWADDPWVWCLTFKVIKP